MAIKYNTPGSPSAQISVERRQARDDRSPADTLNEFASKTQLGSQIDEKEDFYVLGKMALHPDDLITFAKSQAALNASYKQRREKYYQTPVAARMVTGKNLKNLQPLAVRKAEFC